MLKDAVFAIFDITPPRCITPASADAAIRLTPFDTRLLSLIRWQLRAVAVARDADFTPIIFALLTLPPRCRQRHAAWCCCR